MAKRKLQLIAGTTYSISLPKEWVKKNKLKESDELSVIEKDGKSLLVTNEAEAVKEQKLEEFSLNLDEFGSNIDHVLFAAYYLGVENVKLFSKTGIKKEIRAKIRKTLTHMSGTEISYEDNEKILIRVLLDKTKVDVLQLLYRITLILDMSIAGLIEGGEAEEIKINENEIDRLYHLITKMITLAQIDSNVLHSSNIKHQLLAPSYFLLAKRLENTGDEVNHLARYLRKTGTKSSGNKVSGSKTSGREMKETLMPIKNELNRCIKSLMAQMTPASKVFEGISEQELKRLKAQIRSLQDKIVSSHLENMLRYLSDIEEEAVGISFYRQLMQRGMV